MRDKSHLFNCLIHFAFFMLFVTLIVVSFIGVIIAMSYFKSPEYLYDEIDIIFGAICSVFGIIAYSYLQDSFPIRKH